MKPSAPDAGDRTTATPCWPRITSTGIPLRWQPRGLDCRESPAPRPQSQAGDARRPLLHGLQRLAGYVVEHTSVSLGAAMYGWDDDEIQQTVREGVGGRAPADGARAGLFAGWRRDERELLGRLEARLPAGVLGSDLVIGRSRKHAISHLKLIRSDDIIVGGSTNLSASGEGAQNNEAIFMRSAAYALESQAKIDLCRAEMAAQMGAAAAKR